MQYQWANPENIGVIRYEGERVVYIDGGPEYDAALKSGPAPFVPPPKPDPVAILAAERATMACTPMQGILALGEANWNTVLAYRDTAPWQERVIVDSAQTWVRNSQNIAFFQYLLQFTDEQVDDLFRAAARVII